MSLADLKKKKPQKKRKKLTVEDFIDDAQAYSKGEPNISRPEELNQPTSAGSDCKKSTKKRTRHATFSLSEQCIAQLGELAQESGVNKSKLIRMMVKQIKEQGSVSIKNISPDEDLD
ncbi:ribbon-helix-helix protein, CopG family [Psychrobium sp. 1_MG-2023]|uniref:ribbon-helix-helix protein, CopG family n=1 Tax=Psychrobium sp. 1_MG-2023 TaxID=3062624 RepID=UPI002732B44F|nr:ribbon-helix-helix protein, CopG family [Psychrobium sp. 1_MG-2023]MDP2560583.1 ribbon-helix-helix protein, CopG family [Psychrobium sp. 1_MG-2023]